MRLRDGRRIQSRDVVGSLKEAHLLRVGSECGSEASRLLHDINMRGKLVSIVSVEVSKEIEAY